MTVLHVQYENDTRRAVAQVKPHHIGTARVYARP